MLPAGSRIAFVLPALRMGGAEQVVRLLAKEMMSRHEVMVVAAFDGGPMQSVFEEDGIPLVVRKASRRITNPVTWMLSLAESVVQLKDIFVSFAPDIINLHLMGPEIDVLLASRMAGTHNVVVTIHNTYPLFSSKRLLDRIKCLRLRISYAVFRAVIAVSEEVRDWAVCHKIIHAEDVFVVRNGIDLTTIVDCGHGASLRNRHGIPAESFVFINVASLTPKKGHTILLEAIAQLPNDARAGCLFLLVGDGPEQKRLKEQASALGIQQRVLFLGVRHDVPELLASSDVFVIASHYEGISLALLEAMATGLPIVSSLVAGSTLLIRDGVNGFLVRSNDPTSLSRRLLYCIQHPEQIRRFGWAARSTVLERFGVEQMVQSTEYVFARVIQQEAS